MCMSVPNLQAARFGSGIWENSTLRLSRMLGRAICPCQDNFFKTVSLCSGAAYLISQCMAARTKQPHSKRTLLDSNSTTHWWQPAIAVNGFWRTIIFPSMKSMKQPLCDDRQKPLKKPVQWMVAHEQWLKNLNPCWWQTIKQRDQLLWARTNWAGLRCLNHFFINRVPQASVSERPSDIWDWLMQVACQASLLPRRGRQHENISPA